MVIAKLRAMFKKKQKTKRKPKELADWEKMYKVLQEHPLTQAKIVNEQLLHSTQESLKKIDERLENIEERVSKIEKTPTRKTSRAPKKSVKKEKEVVQEIQQVTKVKKIVADADMTDEEKRIIAHLKKQGESDASTISTQFKISRSNASLKLNKLYHWGFLDKRLDEKTVFYKIKD